MKLFGFSIVNIPIYLKKFCGNLAKNPKKSNSLNYCVKLMFLPPVGMRKSMGFYKQKDTDINTNKTRQFKHLSITEIVCGILSSSVVPKTILNTRQVVLGGNEGSAWRVITFNLLPV